MTPEETKAAALKELARRELARREAERTAAPASDVSRETIPNEPPYMAYIRSSQEQVRSPDFEGMAKRADDLVRGAASAMTFGTADEIAAALNTATGLGVGPGTAGGTYEENLAAERARDEASDPYARTTGNVLGALALGGAVGVPKTLGQAVGQSAVYGGGLGFGSGEGGFAERAKEGAIGAATGAAVAAPIYGAANVVAPRAREALQRLYKEGVRPTIGQMAGGAVGRLEEGAQSIPILGQMIRGGRTRALEDFNRGAINHALRPAGIAVDPKTPVGRQVIAEADDLLSKGYSEALDAITDARVDQTFQQDIARIAASAQQRLGKKGLRAFNNAIEDISSTPAMQKPVFTGREIKRAVSGLRQDADRLSRNMDEDVTQAGALIREARDALSDLMKRNTTPENAARLTGLDQAYAGFQRVRAASERGREGFFTPFQYSQAIKQAEKASGRRGFARGEGMGQDLAGAAEEVISSRVPDSGTPERLAPYLLGAAGGAGYISPAAGLGIAAGVAPYTRIGQNTLAALAARQPSAGQKALAEFMRRSAVPAAAGAVAATK